MDLKLVITLNDNTNCHDFLKCVEQLSTLNNFLGEEMFNFYCLKGNTVVHEESIMRNNDSSENPSSLALIELFRLIDRNGDLTLAQLSNDLEVNQ